MQTEKLHGVTIIGRKHRNINGKHHCVTPSLYSNGKFFHEISSTKGLFVNPTNWYWNPAEGFYGLFEIRTISFALMDFYDNTTFNDELTGYVDYLAGA
jgi:hypothetical protein